MALSRLTCTLQLMAPWECSASSARTPAAPTLGKQQLNAAGLPASAAFSAPFVWVAASAEPCFGVCQLEEPD